MLNNFNTLPKGNTNAYSNFGFGSTTINGLTINTARIACNENSDFHLAFLHTAGKTKGLYKHTRESENKKTGVRQRKVLFTYATTDSKEMQALLLAYDNAKILIKEWEIEQLRAKHGNRVAVMPKWRMVEYLAHAGLSPY